MATTSILGKLLVLISGNNAELVKSLNQSSKQLSSFQKSVSTVGVALKSFIGIGTALAIGEKIIEVTAQFERFGAILANTLGSQSAAQQALDSIRVFAQQTPFEVSEITAAYVRWANQGLTPTIDKMTKLGDIASSLGAGFEQTAEAFKDLLVGQTKRIEEIGISAQQSNGKIQLSFKGVNIEIEKNAEGVQKALDTYSQLNGVLGTSEQVALTLGGKISNLKDTYSNLLLTIGSGNSGALKDTVDLFISITAAATRLVETLQDNQSVLGGIFQTAVSGLTAPTKLFLELISGTDDTNKKLEQNNQKLKAIQDTAQAAFDSGNVEAYIKALDQNIFKEEIITEIRRRQAEQVAGENAATVTKIETLDKLQVKLADLNKQFEETDATDKKKLQNIGNDIIATNAQIDAIERLKKARKEDADIAPNSVEFFTKKIQELNAELNKVNATDTARIRILATEIEHYQTSIDRIDRLKKSFIDLNNIQLTPPDLGPLLDPINQVTKTEGGITFTVNESAFDASMSRIEARILKTANTINDTTKDISKDIEINLSGPISGAIDGIAEALGRAAVGVGNFGDDVLKVVATFGAQLGKILIAEGVAILAAKFALKNPYTAIAAGVALVAISSALQAQVADSHSRAFGSTGRNVTGASQINSNSFGESIGFTNEIKLRAEGNDLVAVINSTTKKDKRLGG